MIRDDFAVFILTHGRAQNVKTYKALKKQGYTGKIYIVIDDEDEQADLYRGIYGNRVLQFEKEKIAQTFDTMDTQSDRRTIVYARNACFELAKKIGIRFFLELDDDYRSFDYRFPSGKSLRIYSWKNLDAVFEAMIDFLLNTKADTVAFAQAGDFLGGINSLKWEQKILRKCMNSFFCDVEKSFKFIGRINEDVNTYTTLGSIGWIGLTIMDSTIVQTITQKNKGGMSDVYLDSGTYLKSFYSVMCMPSAVKISDMGTANKRIHHSIDWENCVPKILNEKYKKQCGDFDDA